MPTAKRSDSTGRWTPQATVRSKDLAVAGLIAVLGVAIWIESAGWVPARNLAQDPTVLPRLIAVVFWLVAVSIVVRLVRDIRRERLAEPSADVGGEQDDPAAASPEEEQGNLTGALLSLLVVTVYAWLAFRLGWAVSTLIFLVGSVALLGPRGWSPRRLVSVLLVAAVATAVVWFGFVEVLNVRMPSMLLP